VDSNDAMKDFIEYMRTTPICVIGKNKFDLSDPDSKISEEYLFCLEKYSNASKGDFF